MTKSKKNATPQKLTDEELMQATGGGAYRFVSESTYNSIVHACSLLKDETSCANNPKCQFDKSSNCVIISKIKSDPELKGNEEYWRVVFE